MKIKKVCRYSIWLWLWMLLLTSGGEIVKAQRARRIQEHHVRSGETVYGIARSYAASIEKIYELNPWAKTSIKEGDKLLVPSGTAEPSGTSLQEGKAYRHKIEAGDTLYRLGLRYGVSEEAILKANPGLDPTRMSIGMEIVVPLSEVVQGGGAESMPIVASEEQAEQKSEEVRVLLMLPLQKMPGALEFYEGFLMGLNDLKKSGISVHLKVMNVADDEQLSMALAMGEHRGRDLVIGGMNEDQVREISRAQGYKYHIVPFSRQLDSSATDVRTIQLNQSPYDVARRVVPAFVRKYRGREVCFVRRNGETEDSFAQQLKEALSKEGIRYRTLNISSTSIGILGSSVVLVPVSSDRGLLQLLLDKLDADDPCTLFGYPQWQSYGEELHRKLARYGATFYSSFYFDPYQAESKLFVTKYHAWFSKKLSSGYPKFSVMGYDVARYFVRSYSMYREGFVSAGDVMPSDGLQLDIDLVKNAHGAGWVNRSFYFVTFTPDGLTFREAIR